MEPVDLVLSRHVVKLAQLSKTIQLSSETMNGLISSIEARLKDLNLGVEATVALSLDWRYGYGKVQGHSWCLFNECRVWRSENGSVGTPYWQRSPIKSESRHEKVRCLLTMPKILDALVENSQKLAEELHGANDEVSAMLEQLR